MTEPQPKTISVPRFGSFQPKTTESTPARAGENKKRAYYLETKDEANASANREYRHHRHHHRSRSEQRSHKRPRPSPEVVQKPHARDATPEMFTSDRKGDVNNLIFGGIHRYGVPPFHRFGSGSVLGVPPALKIDRIHGDEKDLVLSTRNGATSIYREKYVFSKTERQKPRLLRIRRTQGAESSNDRAVDFISFQVARKTKRKSREAYDSSESAQDDTDYRSIHGNVQLHNQPEDSELQYATESDSSGSDTGRTIKLDLLTKQESVDFARKVEQYPDDIDGWFALINHQDTLMKAKEEQRQPTDAEIRSTADIKISMYERALENATSLSDRETLLIGLMNEGSKIWEVNRQSEKWEEISNDHIDSLLLWKSYIDFRQTTLSTFRYEEVRVIFVERVKLLSATLATVGHDRTALIYKQLLYVVLRFTIFARESGYMELGVAIWQGLLEYNLFNPSLTCRGEQNMALFKQFWESEVPRIGEPGAVGWSRFVTDRDSPFSAASDLFIVNEEGSLDLKHVFSSWAKLELEAAKSSGAPARTTDAVVEDDPFQVVLASDIEGFILSIPPDSIILRRALINGFLLFCHLPPVWNSCYIESSELWPYNIFARKDLPKCDFASVGVETLSSKPDIDEGLGVNVSSIFENSASMFVSSSESMFGHVWFQTLGNWQTVHSCDGEPVSYKWARTTLQQLTQARFDDDLGEYYLAFESKNEPDNIKKLSKALLKQHPTSLRLYNSYGLIEWSNGRRESANTVFSAALDMSKSMAENDRKDSILVWKSWIWLSLEEMDNETALSRLVSISEGTTNPTSSITPTLLLKARQHLEKARDYCLSSGNIPHAVIYAECLALLEYLSSQSVYEMQSPNQGDIIAALSAFDNFSRLLSHRKLTVSDHHELLLQSAARLLNHHGRIGPYRPALFRHHLEEFLTLFPRNTIFLSLYLVNESRLRVDSRVRSVLRSTVLTPTNDAPTSRLFAIKYEIAFGTVHSARSAFEHALASPMSRLAVGLWKFYIRYCMYISQFRSQVSDVWYRALRACPWAKELYILGFEILEDIVDFEPLKRAWRVMGEKELRVHVDLEDRFDEIRDLEQRDQGIAKIRKLCIK